MLGRYRRKCLQLSVAECEQGPLRDDALAFFAEHCCNNSGSGFGATKEESVNFASVLRWLEARGAHVWVYEVKSAWDLLRGRCKGRWLLGAEEGFELGSLAWYPEGHVVKVDDADGVLQWGVRSEASQSAPWFRSIAGAPKKSKRGAHLAGAENAIGAKGRQGRVLRATQQAGVPSEVGGEQLGAAVAVPGERPDQTAGGSALDVAVAPGSSEGDGGGAPCADRVREARARHVGGGRAVIPGVNDFSSDEEGGPGQPRQVPASVEEDGVCARPTPAPTAKESGGLRAEGHGRGAVIPGVNDFSSE